jgi:hypothetical protein
MDEKVSKEKQNRLFNERSREQQGCTASPPEQNNAHIFSIIKTISKHEE